MANKVDELEVLIKANTEQFNSGLKDIQNKLGSLEKNVGNSTSKLSTKAVALGGIISSVFSKALSAVSSQVDAAVTRLDTLNNFSKVMSNLGIGAEISEASISKLSESLLGLPTNLSDAALAVQRFTSVNNNLQASTDMYLAVNNAILAGGASMEMQKSALEQLTQAYSKGKPEMQDWKTIVQAMPAQLKQIGIAMGYASSTELYDALQSGKISMDDFMKTVMKLNSEGVAGFANFEQQARTATGGVGTSITNLKIAIQKAITAIMNAIGQLNISGFINGIAKAIGTVGNYIAAFIKLVKQAVAWIKALFGGSGSTNEIVKETATASNNMSGIASGAEDAANGMDDANKSAKKLAKQLAGFDEMNVLQEQNSSGSSGNNSVGAGGGFSDYSWGNNLDENVDKVDEIADKIKDKFEKLWNELNKSKAFKSWINIFKKSLDSIATHTKNITGSMKSIWETSLTALTNTLTKFKEPLDNTFANMYDSIASYASNVIDLIFAPFEGFLNGFAQSWNEVSQTVTDGIAIIVNSTAQMIGSVYEMASSTINTIVPTIQSSFEILGSLMGNMLGDWFASSSEWLPQLQEKYAMFFNDLNEGLFKPTLGILSNMWLDFCKSLSKFWDEHGKPILDKVGEFFNGLIEWFNKLWTNILEPIVKPFLEQFKRTWEDTLRPCIDAVMNFVGKLIEGALDIWNKFIMPIINWLTENLGPAFVAIGTTIGGVIDSVVRGIGQAISGIMNALSGIIDFITGVFTANWSRAWEGVKNIFKGIAEAIGGIFKTPINFIIDIINGFIKGINQIKIPDWVPGIGGKGFHINTIQKLATGGITNGSTIAMIGEAGKEAVLPLENNTEWMDILAAKIGANGQTILVKIGEETIIDTVINGINNQSKLFNQNVISI